VQDTSRLHQRRCTILRDQVPFVDNQRIGMVGCAWAAMWRPDCLSGPTHLKTVACIGPGLNQFFTEPQLFNQASPMLRASLANRWEWMLPTGMSYSPSARSSRSAPRLVGVTRTRVPILSIGHRRDFICPRSDIRTLASSSHYGKAIVLDKLR
jgi:esterase FrsA